MPSPAAKFPEVLCIARVPKAAVQNQRGIALVRPDSHLTAYLLVQ